MKRIPQLDSVRAIAILAVFCHHAFKIRLMWMGVDLFFVLSGFLITGVLVNAKHHTLRGFFAHFYARRARRILAPYVLTLVVASFFFGVAWMRHWYLYILFTNFIMPLHIPQPMAFDPLWSLAVEEQFYLAWPLAVYFLSERRLRAGGEVIGAGDNDLLVDDNHLVVHQAVLIPIHSYVQSSLLEWIIFGPPAGFDLSIIHYT